jgi:hypothetical protein
MLLWDDVRNLTFLSPRTWADRGRTGTGSRRKNPRGGPVRWFGAEPRLQNWARSIQVFFHRLSVLCHSLRMAHFKLPIFPATQRNFLEDLVPGLLGNLRGNETIPLKPDGALE